jgi:hypothetical protein
MSGGFLTGESRDGSYPGKGWGNNTSKFILVVIII